MANQTLNPFATAPKETKKPVEPIGGKIGFFDETENNFEDLETSRFISQENFTMEPAAVVEAAETILEESAAVKAAENIIREAAAKPIQEQNTLYGEYQGSLIIGESVKTFLKQTTELKVDPAGPREINISPSDQKEVFATLFSAGKDTLKDAADKTVSTIADTLGTTTEVVKDTLVKVTGWEKKESPKTREEIEKANKEAEQRAHEQKFWANLPVHQPDANVLEALQVGDKVVSKAQFEKAMGIRLTSENLDGKGKLKAGVEAAGEKALEDQEKQDLAATQKANTLAVATKGKGLGKGDLDKGTENPNHFTQAKG